MQDKFETKLKKLIEISPKNIQFLFPVKSFPNLPALKIASKYLHGFDISNQNEANLILPLLNQEHLLWNSAPYSAQIEGFPNIINDGKESQRINLNEQGFKKSRFGQALNTIHLGAHIHVHMGFQDNKEEDYIFVAEKIKEKNEIEGKPLRSLNLGGGFEFKDFESLKNCLFKISELFPDISIYFEPGNWLTNGCVGMIGKILNSKKAHEELILTTSISHLAHLRWSNSIKISSIGNQKADFNKISIFGPTCAETDLLAELEAQNFAYNEGDSILLENVSSYSYAWRTEFNGIEKPDIFVIS